MANFDFAYELIRKYEGGYCNNPNDSGGETVYGIARKMEPTWSGWSIIDIGKKSFGKPLDTPKDWASFTTFLKTLPSAGTLEHNVKAWYKQHYWDVPFRGDQINHDGVATEMFDISVNAGSGRAITWLQSILIALNDNDKVPDLDVDGRFGPNTLARLNDEIAQKNGDLIQKALNCMQGYHYITIAATNRKNRVFTRGWFTRISI